MVHQSNRVLQNGHHAKAEQIDFDEPHVGAIVFVPLQHDAAGHARVFERHDAVELPLADHHAAGMLAEMPRQILHARPELGEPSERRMIEIAAGIDHPLPQRVGGIDELELVHHLRQPIHLRGVDAEHLPHFACRALAAIGDDVGRHRRAEPPVFLVDVLNHPLAPIAARQIEIDVGPLAALFRKEPLEQQIHPDRIDGRDAEAVADGAVGGRPASLHEDVVVPAEIDDVPDDEEVAGEIEPLDEIELARDLRAGTVVIGPVALARAQVGELAEKRGVRLARRHGIVGKAIAEIGHRVFEPFGQRLGRRERPGPVAKQPRHLFGRFQVALGIARELPARLREGRLVVDAGEHVEQRTLARIGKPHAVGRDERHVKRAGDVGQRAVVGLFVAQEMALQLDIHAVAPEQPDERIDEPADAVLLEPQQLASGERDEPARLPVELVECERPLTFRRAHFHARDEPAEVSVAFGGFHQDRQREGCVRFVGSRVRGFVGFVRFVVR